MATCLIVQHAEVEEAFGLADALEDRGVRIDVCRVYAGTVVPRRASSADGVIVMGGPASATSDALFPTRAGELDLLSDAVRLGVPTLGICLGAQLLAAAAGGRIVAGDNGSEIGWAPIDLTPDGLSDPLLGGGSSPITVLHWHGDTFVLPKGAVLLASSARYRHQAFRLGMRAWGLQFHLEVDASAVSGFVGAFGHEAEASGADPVGIQHGAEAALQAGLADWGRAVAGRFADLVVGRALEVVAPGGGSLSTAGELGVGSPHS